VFVDDYVDIKNILNEMNVLDPKRIEDEFVPKLKEIIASSNGRIEDFYLYPQHRPGGLDLIYDSGRRRYPRRLKEKKRKPEDRAIYLNGIEVGFMIARVPYLHTDCWGNQGIGIQVQNQANRQSIVPQVPPVIRNSKKRKLDETNQADEQANPIKVALSEHLPFLKDDSASRADFDVKLFSDDT
jgi:hypothetical protein